MSSNARLLSEGSSVYDRRPDLFVDVPTVQKTSDPLDPPKEHCSLGRGLLTCTFLIAGAACTALKFSNFRGLGEHSVTGSALAFTAGAAFQLATQTALTKRKWVNEEKSFIASYAIPIFLTVSQVYLNAENHLSHKKVDGIFFGLSALGGALVASYAHTLPTRNLNETRGNALEDVTGMRRETLPVAIPSTPHSRAIWNVVKLALGASLIILGSVEKRVFFTRDFGVILAGDSLTQLLNEKLLQAAVKYNKTAGLEDEPSKKLKYYHTSAKAFLAVAHLLPGAFIVFGSRATKNLPLSILFNLLTGVFDGGRRHIEWVRFTQTPVSDLGELHSSPKALTTCEKIFRVAKWTFGIGVVGAFLGLGIGGFSFEDGKFRGTSSIDRVALITFGVGLYGAYGIAECAKRAFNKDAMDSTDTRLINSLYFYTHYSRGIALLALYIMEKQRLGDDFLTESPELAGILGAIAYASLGIGLGLEMNGRSDFPHPRVISALGATLFGKYLAAALTGQVRV